jgi:Membrane domain of glycerophosphoryl diester phosphodiesterase
MTSEVVTPSQLDIVRVIQRTWETAKFDFGAKFGVAALLVGLPSAAGDFLQTRSLSEGVWGQFSLPVVLIALLTVLTSTVVQVALLRSAARQMAGETSPLGENLAFGLRLFLPALGFSILAGLAVACGLVLLIVPGVMLACAWCVGLPALVLEGTRVMGAFSRSAELTRGERWRIFGLFAAMLGIIIVAAIVIGVTVGIPAAVLSLFGGAAALGAVLNGLLTAVITVFAATASAVLYDELRNRPPRSAVQEIVDILR